MSMNEARAYRIITKFVLRRLEAMKEMKDSKRRSIFIELIQTERNYVEGLTTCKEIYYKPLDSSINTEKPLIDSKTLSSLFGNIDKIRECHEEGLLNYMDEILPAMRKPFAPSEIYISLANKFLEILPHMQTLYRAYLQTNENSDAILDGLRKHKKFKKFVSRCIYNPKAKCRSIEDFLILPLQRIAAYKCLFERALKYFPESMEEEHKIYKHLLGQLLGLGSEMNKAKSDDANQDLLYKISETVSKAPSYLQIMRAGRKYVGKYKLSYLDHNTGRETERGSSYLFNDILLLVRKVKTGMHTTKFIYEDCIPITSIKFQATTFQIYAEKACHLRTDINIYELLFNDSKERDAFVSSIKKQQKKISKRIRDQTKNGLTHIQTIISDISTSYKEPKKFISRAKLLSSW